MKTEIVYLGHDNSIDLLLKADGVAQSLSAVTKISISFNDKLIESTNGDTEPIRWNKGGYQTGEIRLFLGLQTIPVGNYNAPLVVYDGTNLEGIVWGKLLIKVVEEVEGTTS